MMTTTENGSPARASARPLFYAGFARLLIFGFSSLFGGEPLFDIKENAGEWTLYFGDEPLGDLRLMFDDIPNGINPKTEARTLSDGTRVWNRYSEEDATRYREEIALPPDNKSVEITFSTQTYAYPEIRSRHLTLEIPYSLVEGGSFLGLTGNPYEWAEKGGEFTADLPDGLFHTSIENLRAGWRFFTIKDARGRELLFDFNPRGPYDDEAADCDNGAVRSQWEVQRRGDKLLLSSGVDFTAFGGMSALKLVITAGTFGDYDKRHSRRTYSYRSDFPPEAFYSFGAETHGGQYTSLDRTVFTDENQRGWRSAETLRVVGNQSPGAYYSAVAGTDQSLILRGFRPGLYCVTVGVGNDTGEENHFSIVCNGREVLSDFSLPQAEAADISFPVWLDEGEAVLDFRGDFLISTLGVQMFATPAEDFTFRRNFWVSDGFEPSVIYNNANTAEPPVYKTVIDRYPMPKAGQEQSGPLKPFVRQTCLPAADNPALMWRFDAMLRKMCGNSSAVFEYDEPTVLNRFMDELQSQHVTAVLNSGLHSRHTYPANLQRTVDVLRRYSEAAHQRGIKVVDHHDATLLWNEETGHRVMLSRLDQVSRQMGTQLPNFMFCIMNPKFNETYYEYLRALVRAGLDGLMTDEIYFPDYHCTCSHCRASFKEETGWDFPLNECDPRIKNKNSELWRAWIEWRKKKIGDWEVNLRRELNKINPNITLMTYSSDLCSPWAPEITGLDLTEMVRGCDYIGTEIMTRNVFMSVRCVLALINFKNVFLADYGLPSFSWSYHSTWEAVYLCWAMHHMHHQATPCPEMVCPEGGTDFYPFLGRTQELGGGRPLITTGVLFLPSARDRNVLSTMEVELIGLVQTLQEARVPCQVIGGGSMTAEKLSKYPVIFTGTLESVSDEAIELLKEYVRGGGRLCVTGATALFDQWGNPREEWGFAEPFGFSPEPRRVDTTELFRRDGSKCDNLAPLPDSCPFSGEGMEAKEATAAYVTLADGSQPKLLYRADYGKGTIFYTPTMLGSMFHAPPLGPRNAHQNPFRYDTNTAAVFHELLDTIIGEARYWKIDAPRQVYTTLYRKEGKLIIHLLNATGVNPPVGLTVDAATLPEVPFPPMEKDMPFEIPFDRKASRIYAISPDYDGQIDLAFSQSEDNLVKAVLPKEGLKAYTMIVIE